MRLILNFAFATMALAQSSAATMKAIVAHEYGGPEVLKYEDAPRPEPKENELLVRVIACGVNASAPMPEVPREAIVVMSSPPPA